MKRLKNPNKSHPGVAGRKQTIQNPITPKVYIDQKIRDIYTAYGNGNFSAGIRKAVELVIKYGHLQGE